MSPFCPTHRRPMRVEQSFTDTEPIGVGSYNHSERDTHVTTWACPMYVECRETAETVEGRQS